AAETTELGRIPELSQIGLHADAALNAMKDCGLKPADIDGVATAGETPTTVAHYLGITPKWVDGTAVGGCSFMIHVRHAAAALESGLCKTVLIAYPFRLLMCCLVTDGGGALILTTADRAKDFPTRPVYLLGTGESVETPMISQMADFTSSRAFRVAGAKAFEESGIAHNDVDH